MTLRKWPHMKNTVLFSLSADSPLKIMLSALQRDQNLLMEAFQQTCFFVNIYIKEETEPLIKEVFKKNQHPDSFEFITADANWAQIW